MQLSPLFFLQCLFAWYRLVSQATAGKIRSPRRREGEGAEPGGVGAGMRSKGGAVGVGLVETPGPTRSRWLRRGVAVERQGSEGANRSQQLRGSEQTSVNRQAVMSPPPSPYPLSRGPYFAAEDAISFG